MLTFAYSGLRKFWTIDKDIADLKEKVSKQEENYKEVVRDIKQELKEIRDDIKTILMQLGKNKSD